MLLFLSQCTSCKANHLYISYHLYISEETNRQHALFLACKQVCKLPIVLLFNGQ